MATIRPSGFLDSIQASLYNFTGDSHRMESGSHTRRMKLAVNGGGQATWRYDGKEMFCRTGGREMMAVSLRTTPGFATGVLRMLFQSSADSLFPNLGIPYAVAAMGGGFW
jgi:hypothetical protein